MSNPIVIMKSQVEQFCFLLYLILVFSFISLKFSENRTINVCFSYLYQILFVKINEFFTFIN